MKRVFEYIEHVFRAYRLSDHDIIVMARKGYGFDLRRPNRRFTVDQLLGSECPRRLFDARWPCIFNDQGLIWNYALRSIVFFINPFHTDSCLII